LLGIYAPAISLGDSLWPSSGPAGHAMAGGAILSWLIAIVVYSLLIGIGIALFKHSHRD
jgi:high-affinity Fe2+/Pb2+ permease